MYFSTSDRSRNSVCPLPVMEASSSITEEDRHTSGISAGDLLSFFLSLIVNSPLK
jgi:hypothetical protein